MGGILDAFLSFSQFSSLISSTHFVTLFILTSLTLSCSYTARWIDEDTLVPEATKHADSIIKAGMQQLPNNPYMIILYSSFLIDVQGSYQSGYVQLQTAKKADPRYGTSSVN